MGRTVDAYQWRLLFFKQCKYSWLLSKHYWCTIGSYCDKFWEESIELHYCFSRLFYGIDNTKSSSTLNLTTFDECGFYGIYCSKNLTCFCGRVVSKIHSSTLILTCLWTSKRVLTKALLLVQGGDNSCVVSIHALGHYMVFGVSSSEEPGCR